MTDTDLTTTSETRLQAVIDDVRATLRATHHAVTDDLDRDVDAAIDLERSRRADALTAVAMLLGHPRDQFPLLKLTELLESVRRAALDSDRCPSCPWSRGIECGGAAGICPGIVRPTVAEVVGQVRRDGPGTLTERWVSA